MTETQNIDALVAELRSDLDFCERHDLQMVQRNKAITAILDDRDRLVVENEELRGTNEGLRAALSEHSKSSYHARMSMEQSHAEILQGQLDKARARLTEAERVIEQLHLHEINWCYDSICDCEKWAQLRPIINAANAFLANAPAEKPQGEVQ